MFDLTNPEHAAVLHFAVLMVSICAAYVMGLNDGHNESDEEWEEALNTKEEIYKEVRRRITLINKDTALTNPPKEGNSL
jgi:hypothetical protein